MKTGNRSIPAVLSLSLAIALSAAEKQVGGPKGGRLLENEAPRAEFFVEKDRTVTIAFYDKDLKPVPPGEQVVTAIAETKPGQGKEKLEFEKKGGALVSRTPLPEGDGYTVVVQIKAKPGAKAQNFRIKYDTSTCGKCRRAEYACICDE
jgi:hypothetical protein